MSKTGAIEHTVSVVAQEASEQLQTELKVALDEALRIISDSQEETSKTLRSSSIQLQKKIEATKRQILGLAELKSRNLILSEIENAIGEAFEEGLKLVAKEQSQRKRNGVLQRLIEEALDMTGGRSFIIEASEADQSAVKEIASRIAKDKKIQIQVAEEPLSCVGGVKLTSQDGSVAFDNTYETRLERAKPVLRRVLSELFGRTS